MFWLELLSILLVELFNLILQPAVQLSYQFHLLSLSFKLLKLYQKSTLFNNKLSLLLCNHLLWTEFTNDNICNLLVFRVKYAKRGVTFILDLFLKFFKIVLFVLLYFLCNNLPILTNFDVLSVL